MKRGTPDHPKFKELCRLLKVRPYMAAGILELMWHFTAKYAPRGDIGRFSDEEIATAIGWKVNRAQHLIKCLVTSRWLDSECIVTSDKKAYRLVVHDWADHADQTVTRLLARRKLDIIRTPEPTPEPLPATTARYLVNGQPPPSDFPRSSEFIKARFPMTDDLMIDRIVGRAVQEVLSAGLAPDLVNDKTLLMALEECSRSSPRQRSAGLYLTTIATWYKNMAAAEAS